MADGDTTTPSILDNPQLAQILQQLMPQQPQAAPAAPVQRSWTSLLGEAAGGGTPPGYSMSPAEAETAGNRALLSLGVGMLGASGYSPVRRTLGEVIARGVGGAQQSEAETAQALAARLGATQEYAQKQQEMQLARVKEAVPLLTLQTQLQQAAAARNLALGNRTPTSIGAAGTGGIGAAGNPPIIARDQSVTAGQQGNNSGNLMVPPGGSLPTGATGVIPLSGGRNVAAFPDVATGIAAQSDNLNAYATTHGISTVHDAVARWVGDPKADLTSYENDIAAKLGVKPGDKIDLTDPKVQSAFFMAQQPHESGRPWLNAADVDKGIALAQARRKGGAPAVAATPPAASTAPPAPVVGKGTPIPSGRPTGPPIITDQPAGGAIVAGPPGTATVGQPLPPSPAVSGDVGAIVAGMTRAGASPGTLAPGAPTAGPAAPTAVAGTPVAAPVAQPATQAQLPVPQATTPTSPAVTAPPTGGMPEPAPFKFERGPLPATIQARIDNPAAHVSPDLTTALQVAAASGDIGKMAAAKAAVGAAADSVRATANQEAEAFQTNERNKGQELWQKRWDAWNANESQRQQAAQKLENDLRLKAAEAEQTRTSSAQAADIARQEKRMEALDTAGGASRDSLNDLDMLRSLSASVGSASPWTQIEIGGRKIQDWMTRFQLGSPEQLAQMGNQQAYEAVVNKIIVGLRSGVSMGNLSDRDLDFIRNQAPDLMQNPKTRGNIIGFLEQVYQRKLDFAQTVGKYYRPGSVSVADAEARADKELGPILKQLPRYSDLSGEPQRQAKDLWIYQNIRPGTFYKSPGGKLVPYNPPPGWQPAGAEAD